MKTTVNEARLLAREDARQLLTSLHLLEQEIAIAEEQGRFVTADRLQVVLERTEALYRHLVDFADGIEVKPAEEPATGGILAGLDYLIGLPCLLLAALGGLLARKPVANPEPVVELYPAQPDVTVACRACSAPMPDAHADFCDGCNPAVPVADLAPTLFLGYTPEPKPARGLRAARKAKVMPAAARSTAEVLFVKRGKRYVEAAKGKPGEQRYRKVGRRYQAA